MPTRFLRWFYAIAILLFLVTLSFVAKAEDRVATHGKNSVRITDAPCTNPVVLQWLVQRGQDAADYRAGVANFGVIYNLCWIRGPDGVYLIYEDGDSGKIELNELHSPPNT